MTQTTSTGEVAALTKQLEDTRELAVVGVKAAISALAAIEEALKALRPTGLYPSTERDGHLDAAEVHVKRGLEQLRQVIEGGANGGR